MRGDSKWIQTYLSVPVGRELIRSYDIKYLNALIAGVFHNLHNRSTFPPNSLPNIILVCKHFATAGFDAATWLTELSFDHEDVERQWNELREDRQGRHSPADHKNLRPSKLFRAPQAENDIFISS